MGLAAASRPQLLYRSSPLACPISSASSDNVTRIQVNASPLGDAFGFDRSMGANDVATDVLMHERLR